MKKHIAEELPARKHPQAAQASANKGSEKDQKSDGKTPEDRVRQAVYDIRYRARREQLPLRQAYSQYMQNSSMSEMDKVQVRKKLFGKGPMNEDFYIEDVASQSVANAMFKIFVEGANDNEGAIDIEKLKGQLYEASKPETSESKKYKVRVTDNNGVSYVRYATRQKISELRANPNIKSVEMTEYGDPYEGERTNGEQTARAKSGKDYDRDGKVESGAKEYRGSVHNAIQSKRGGVPDGKDTSNVREGYMLEIAPTANLPQTDDATYESDEEMIDILPLNKKNKVVVNPQDSLMAHHKLEGHLISETSYSRFLRMIQEREMTVREKNKEKKLKKKYDPSEMKASMIKQYGPEKGKEVYFATIRKQSMKEENCECDDSVDTRGDETKRNLIKNKFRAMGIKNPIVMSAGYEPDGEVIDEKLRSREERMARTITPTQRKKQEEERKKKEELEHRGNLALAGMRKTAKKGAVTRRPSSSSAPEANRQLKPGQKKDTLAVRASEIISSDYQPKGKIISEREFDEPGEEDWRPDVRAHNRAVGYRKPYKRRPKPENPGPASQAKPAD